MTNTLTTGVDTFTGGANSDTFNAYYNQTGGSTDSTLTATDVINGGAGVDTLNVTTAGTPTGFNGASIQGIEILNLRATADTGTVALATAAVSGLTELNATGTGAVTVTGLNSGAAYGLVGDGAVTLGAQSATYGSTATTATLNIRGGVGPTGTTAPTVAIGGAATTSAVINSTGATNTIGTLNLDANTGGTVVTSATVNATTKLTTGAWTAAALKTLTITGAGAVDTSTTALASTVTTVDASANSGGVTVALGSSTTQKVTGGSGNDVITAGSVLTTGSVDAGAGSADVLDLGTNVSYVNTAALAAKYTNFEILRVNGTYDMSLLPSFTGVQLSGATNSVTNLTATQAANVTARADIGATTIALANSAGTSDALTLTLGKGTTTSAAANTGVLTITGFETLNMVENGGPTATAGTNRTSTITGAIVDANLTAINLTGRAFNFSDIATTKAVTIDGTALTGDGATTSTGLTVAGSAKAGSTIKGSAVHDDFTVGAEGSTYDAGAGNDTVTISNTVLLPDGTTDATLIGGAGTDTLTITNAMTLTDVYFTNVSGFEKLTTALTSAVSVTGLAAAAKAAFADGITMTSGTLADDATYTWGSGLYDKSVTLTLTSSGVGNTTADNIDITTGSGADTITVTAASWVGHATTNGAITVTTGAGADTITVSTGTFLANANQSAVVINAGTGADNITVTHTNSATASATAGVKFTIAAGDSTTTAYDSITGFKMSDIGGTGGKASDGLDFATVGITAYAATAPTGYAASELTVAVNGTTGAVTFAGTAAAGLTFDQKVSAIQAVVTTNSGDSAFFTYGSDTYVFNNNSAGDSLVKLVGVTAAALITTNDATTDNGVFIQ